MKIRTDHDLVASRQRLGRWTAFGGLLILIAGLVISFQWKSPAMIALTYATLIVGMLLSSIGIYLADKWVREPRADQALEAAMKGFDDRYCLYNYVLPAEHVLVSPYGVTVLTVKRHGDTVRYVNGRWKHEQNLLKRMQSLSRERLGNPLQQLEHDVARMQQLLARRLPDVDIPVGGVVVFTDPTVALHVDGAPGDVLHVKKLKNFMRRSDRRGARLGDDGLRGVREVLDGGLRIED